ncbi:Ankyrin repeat-containing protein [Penicillium malachiteum]|uniref:Ankyrin repeat-containing protein n=1 Tax=Penicillium malachiteum TaxID=1324776 RepID=A0AAD6N032_9EURO|nr:Ankyrin repeat-containing protein [Penicillium malachiteum]
MGPTDNTNGEGINTQANEASLLGANLSISSAVENSLEQDQERQAFQLASTGQQSSQEFDVQNLMLNLLEKGNTPLHQAVSCAQISIVRLPLDRGADQRSVNILGKTPLHLAAELGNTEMV